MCDTAGVVAALWEGGGFAPESLISEMTTPDGTVAYQYDPAGQLLGATYSTGQPDETYSYDANGNRLTANGAAYLTGPNNQLLFDGTYWYAYDPEGNRTARFVDANGNGVLDAGDTAVTTYTWDHRNRLTRVTDYDVYGDAAVRAVDYLYDVENRWIGRDVDLGADGQIDSRTRFAYDGNQIVLQFDRAAGDPAEPLTGEDLSHRYLWNPAAVDQLMADEHVTDPAAAGDVLWPLADHLGTIRDLAAYDPATDTTTVVNHRVFDSYGNLLSQSTTNPAHDTLFAFTARPLDPATALQNNLHRWYDPAVGRWISEDPIGFEGRDGNLARYVGNSPENATDPSGLLTRDAKRLVDLYELMKSSGPSHDQMVSWLIIDALTISNGNAPEAFALVYEIRNSPLVSDNDIWACVDHFFQSWTVQDTVPVSSLPELHPLKRLYAGSGAWLANTVYSTLKLSPTIREQHLQRDKDDSPPSPVTWAQYRWGSRGAWAALRYSTDLYMTSPEWQSFLGWLDD